jgi:glutathione S-transferase
MSRPSTAAISRRRCGRPAGVTADIDRVTAIWRERPAAYGGSFLFGENPTMADAMSAPVATRLSIYDIRLDSDCAACCAAVMALPAMQEGIEDAKSEPEKVEELDVAF